MTSKVLFTASIAKHILRFHLPYLEWFQEQGYETHVACEGDENIPHCDKRWHIPFVRSPYSLKHLKVYEALREVIDREQYVMIHCHTPVASVITRLAARRARQLGTKVLYTAHGFHFYKNGPWLNWITYYPVELLASKWADGIITINHEDYNRIRAKGASQTNYHLVPGVGVKDGRFGPVEAGRKAAIRKKNNLDEDDFLLVYAAEFIPRKNHEFLIRLAPSLFDKLPQCKILFAGRGALQEEMENLVRKMGLTKKILFLGFREDINEVYRMSDIGISASKQEGLPLNTIEEMMCGLPILATMERGHNELIEEGENGYLFEPEDAQAFETHAVKLWSDKDLYRNLSTKAVEKSKQYSLSSVLSETTSVYENYLVKEQV